jgi:hypothetical protein
LVVTFYVSPVAALILGFIGDNIIREISKPNSSLNPDAQKRRTG